MRRTVIALVAVALVVPATASAGLVLGLRTGASMTGGEIEEGAKIRDFAGSMVPVQLEAGWKLAERLTLSGFATMSFGLVSGDFADVCDAGGSDCTANQARFGAQAQWSFMPSRRLDPWVGVGVARETLGIESISGSSGVNTNYEGTGWDVQAGFDYRVGRRFSVSPFLGYSFGTYTKRKVISDPFSDWEPVANEKTHSLFTLGVRVGWELLGAPRAEAEAVPAASGT
jgi:hypothetical protein